MPHLSQQGANYVQDLYAHGGWVERTGLIHELDADGNDGGGLSGNNLYDFFPQLSETEGQWIIHDGTYSYNHTQGPPGGTLITGWIHDLPEYGWWSA